MDNVARRPRSEREELFAAAADATRSFIIIEKDFWVVWTLWKLSRTAPASLS